MFGLVIVVVLVSTVIVGTVLGRRYRVGPPVLLIVLGALLGLIPAFGGVRINGEMVLLLFLPAILYWESMNTSFREIRANLRVIVFLSIALVIATAVAVSWTARALGMESHAAAVLGAVLSPTDAAAVAGLAKRLPRRTLTVLRAESIINDGTALVLFIVTVHVAVGGAAIGPIDLVVRFIGSYLGGIAAGLLVGGLVTLLRRGIDAPLEEGALSVLTPFAAFLLAQSIHCSGVVAVMVSALVLAYSGPVVIRARSRLQAYAFWDIATFLINGSLWVFVGVQIPGALRGISNVGGGLHHAAFIALAITGVIIVSRIFWEEFTTVLIRVIDRREVQRTRRVGWRQRIVTAWAGFRGAVSLAAALAVPLTTLSGAPFPDRNLIIFVVTMVILVTVLIQGSTLPAVVRWARMPEDVAHADELQLARSVGAQTALDALPAVASELGVGPKLLSRLQKEYEEHAAVVSANDDDSATNDLVKRSDLVRRVRLGVIEHQRRAVTDLRNQNLIDDIVLRELQAELDLAEVQLLDAADTD
ncbi:Na+/H+ antiporter [Mycobacterium haemophilum]|uniref:Na+/H+ transporter n=1 Tax=Mycobacterium haemophilum TaxID=29311 RepID=A0A0I9Y958_9MYCO|nr:Na+/H+ antiporter [Mycobacterium haemophilum]KLO31970.1 Na+/H+ transporter [Mycobacterium haemophilum]KLO36322.1 Na+/H+ transporter [Mycobacterium haemophilum]KLO42206.1 Na+/H+ transporter [Mycobacterium haemophilum]KLO50008.1 Na+/H+ transporter [Mycobacterium haemophilum]